MFRVAECLSDENIWSSLVYSLSREHAHVSCKCIIKSCSQFVDDSHAPSQMRSAVCLQGGDRCQQSIREATADLRS